MFSAVKPTSRPAPEGLASGPHCLDTLRVGELKLQPCRCSTDGAVPERQGAVFGALWFCTAGKRVRVPETQSCWGDWALSAGARGSRADSAPRGGAGAAHCPSPGPCSSEVSELVLCLPQAWCSSNHPIPFLPGAGTRLQEEEEEESRRWPG